MNIILSIQCLSVSRSYEAAVAQEHSDPAIAEAEIDNESYCEVASPL